MNVTIFLMDFESDAGFVFRPWDGTRREIFARVANAGTTGKIEISVEQDEHETTNDVLERIFAATNGFPHRGDDDLARRYREGYVYERGARSLAVGDLVSVPGEGVFAVERIGFKRTHVRVEVMA